MENTMDEKKGLEYYIKLCQKKDKEIERLRKEKEWLMYKMIDVYKRKYKECTMEDMKKMLSDDMQQALKGE